MQTQLQTPLHAPTPAAPQAGQGERDELLRYQPGVAVLVPRKQGLRFFEGSGRPTEVRVARALGPLGQLVRSSVCPAKTFFSLFVASLMPPGSLDNRVEMQHERPYLNSHFRRNPALLSGREDEPREVHGARAVSGGWARGACMLKQIDA